MCNSTTHLACAYDADILHDDVLPRSRCGHAFFRALAYENAGHPFGRPAKFLFRQSGFFQHFSRLRKLLRH
jgi:hypothetical protein